MTAFQLHKVRTATFFLSMIDAFLSPLRVDVIDLCLMFFLNETGPGEHFVSQPGDFSPPLI